MGDVRVMGVPIDSVGGRVGTVFGPAALRRAGVVDALGASDLGDLDVLIDPPERDPETGIVGAASVFSTTGAIREAVARHADPGARLVLLGGCCTLAVGAVAGFRQRFGEIGVVYVDGHMDLYDGRNSPSGEAADMPLAVVLGVGPHAWADAAGDEPLLRPDQVALLGFRDLQEARELGSVTPDDLPGLTAMTTADLRERGFGEAGAAARGAVSPDGGPFFAFLDIDVLDGSVCPNDAPVPDGIDWPELTALLRPVVGADECLGVAIACFNPERDPDGVTASRLVALLRDTVLA
jgi:arginase